MCDFDPESPDKKKRSDFFLNYKAIERNGAPEYYLHLLEGKKQTQLPDVICEKERYAKLLENERANDESPCSSAGYGGEYKGLTGTSGT